MDSFFSAKEPSLGYLFQLRYGLMLIVSETNENAQILIETIDDISIETADLTSVYQTKLHINSVTNLTNASTDLWKTIRVWSEGIKSGLFNLDNCLFNLVTTANASTGTIPFKLKYDNIGTKDITAIQKLFLDESLKTTNVTNKAGYDAFRDLTDNQQKKLIKNIIVVDASIDLNKAKEKTLIELRHSTFKVEPLYERLEGWFIGQVILQLQNLRNEISAKEVNNKIIDIADRLKDDNLPDDFNASISYDDVKLAPYKNHIFVKQMDLIEANQRLTNNAISDYHRAYSQKSKWMREGLISGLDEIEYDKKLAEDWDRKFAIISESKTADNEDNQKEKGMVFYLSHYVTTYPQIHIKERFKEQYMVTGSCHILSDKKKMGWHPDFENKII
jgi:hypothetical protein